MWDAVNTDHEVLVPWKSVFSGLAQVMAGTLDDKASFYFSLHDTDGNGDMDKSEVRRPHPRGPSSLVLGFTLCARHRLRS